MSYYNQSRSNLPKTGEPQSHKNSAQIVCDFVSEVPGYTAEQREKFTFSDNYKHEFDVVIRNKDGKITHFVEVGDIGDDSKHQFKTPFAPNKGQQENDSQAKGHVEEFYPEAEYVKINKGDCYYKNWVLGYKLGIID